MKLVVIGGVAGGASAAARARRLSEDAEIVIFERGPDVSFANCGLPYHIGEVIPDRNKLLVVTPERLKERFNLDVRVRSSVEAIDRDAKKLTIRDLASDREYEESYDDQMPEETQFSVNEAFGMTKKKVFHIPSIVIDYLLFTIVIYICH